MSRLDTSSSKVKPLDLNKRETVNGEMKTPRRLVATERRRARGKLPLHYNNTTLQQYTWSARMAAEARTVGAQHIIAIPIFSSTGVIGTFSTKYPANGVTRSTNTQPRIKC